MTHASLFSGIGGFDLAAEWAGWDNIFHCEWNPFGRKVLNYHFPKSLSYDDITKTDFNIHRKRIDVLTGGFPCQPYSIAGLRKGNEDERHLWPEMLRAIREIQPRWIVGENVRGLVNWGGGVVFDEVQTNLENQGYEVQPFIIPACSVNAPHRRERIWFIAHSLRVGLEQKISDKKLAREIRPRECIEWDFQTKESLKSGICWENDGVSEGLDEKAFSNWRKETTKAYGNAIVPQVAYEIFKAINTFESIENYI